METTVYRPETKNEIPVTAVEQELRFGLKSQTIRKICDVFAHFTQVERVIIYGSRAKGTFSNGSDVDLTIFGETMDFDTLSRINVEIEEPCTPYLFDISINSHIQSPSLREHIDRVGKVFYEKK